MEETLAAFIAITTADRCPCCLLWEVKDIEGDMVANDIRASSEFEAKEIAWIALKFVNSMIEHEQYLMKNN